MAEEKAVPVAEIVTWLKEHAIPFESILPASGFDDLQPLKAIIGDARIVALGDATHGTSEFFTMKHRLLEFLVKEMGFNLFGIEASWPESNLVNDYVHTGRGDPAQLLAGLHFWTWNTQEVLNMIHWMRAHNEQPGNAPMISFFGFDMQFVWMAIDTVLSHLQKVAPDRVEEVRALYQPFRQYEDDYLQLEYEYQPSTQKMQIRENLRRVYEMLSYQRTAYEASSSPQEFAHALQSARIVMQAERRYSGEDSPFVRDLYMAENVTWLLQQAGENAKIVFGILLQGKGQVWIDDVQLGMVGSDVPTTEVVRES